MSPGPGESTYIVVYALGAALGYGWIYLGWRNLRRLLRSWWWPAAAGRIVRSEWRERDADEFHAGFNRFQVDIVYEYDVAGQRYRGERLGFGLWGLCKTLQGCRGYVERFPPDTPCRVYFDPEHPAEAILIKRTLFDPPNLMTYAVMGVGGGCVLALGETIALLHALWVCVEG